MIATDRLVFLHLHKSGGTFVNECLLRFVPGARQIGYHLPRMLVPKPYAQLPVLGLVRNPWSYYVSWYTFQARRPHPNALFRILSDGGRLGFEATLVRLLDLGADSPVLDAIVAALPTVYSNRGLNLPGFALAPIRDTQLGFYSYLERYLHGEPGPGTHIGRMETLRADVLAMLARVEQPVGADMRLYLLGERARNTTEHDSYTGYYGEALRDHVAARDAALIARHGYRFGE